MGQVRRVAHVGDGGGLETLPPPGDERREVLAERADKLAEAAETIAPDAGAIDPRAFEVESELAQHFNELELPGWAYNRKHSIVTSPDGAYVPCWVQCGSSWGGRFINAKRYEGWEVVSMSMHDDKNFPLPEHLRYADNTIRLGDVLLMRIPTARYLMIQQRRRVRQQAVEDGVAGEVEELASRAGVNLVHTHEMDPKTLDRLARRSQAQQIAARQFDQQIREGRVAGAPAPR